MGDVASKNIKCHGLYNPASKTETQWMCKSISSLLGCLLIISDEEFIKSVMTKLTTSLLSLLKHLTLQKSTCIINTNNVVMVQEEFALSDGKELDAETNDALAYAIFSQANELSIMTVNILTYWCPIIGLDTAPIVQFVLEEIISLRILPILETFQTIHKTCADDTMQNMQQSLVQTIYDAVKSAGLFDMEQWNLCTAPLRTAAQKNGVS
jgi:hypothetical protein